MVLFIFSLFWQVSSTKRSELRVGTRSIDRDETSPIYQRQGKGNESSVTCFVNPRKTADHYGYSRCRVTREVSSNESVRFRGFDLSASRWSLHKILPSCSRICVLINMRRGVN